MSDKTMGAMPSGPYLVAASGFWTKEGIEALLAERDRLRAEVVRLRGTLEAVRNFAVDRLENDEDDEDKE